MEGQFHIGRDGLPKPCKAKIQCRYKDINPDINKHFDSYEEAINFMDEYNSKEATKAFKRLGTTYSSQDTTFKSKNSLEYKIWDKLTTKKNGKKINPNGLKTEVYLLSNYAKSMGLNSVIVKSANGFEDINGNEEIEEIKTKAIERARAELDVNITEAHIQSIYYNKDNPNRFVVHLGTSQYLDGAVLDEHSSSIIEMKKGHQGGSQLSQIELGWKSNGEFNVPEESELNEYIRDSISHHNWDETKNQKTLKFDNNIVPTWHFVESYKNKGASHLLITGENGAPYYVDLDRPTDQVVNELIANNYEVKIKIRTNQTVRNIDLNNQDAWGDILANCQSRKFVFDEDPSDKTRMDWGIKTSSIDVDKLETITRGGKKYLKLDRFVLPFNKDNFKKYKEENEFVNMSEMKEFIPVLSGDLRKRMT